MDIDVFKHTPATRDGVLALEAAIKQMEQVECPVMHHFAPSNYAREIHMPAGSVIIGKIHKHAHVNVISQGHVTVVTEFERKEYFAPCTFVSEPHIKRAVYCHTDTRWTTIHPTEETDLEKIEDEVIAKNYDELLLDSKPMAISEYDLIGGF
jgi:hypothetical protein